MSLFSCFVTYGHVLCLPVYCLSDTILSLRQSVVCFRIQVNALDCSMESFDQIHVHVCTVDVKSLV